MRADLAVVREREREREGLFKQSCSSSMIQNRGQQKLTGTVMTKNAGFQLIMSQKYDFISVQKSLYLWYCRVI